MAKKVKTPIVEVKEKEAENTEAIDARNSGTERDGIHIPLNPPVKFSGYT